MLLKSNNFFFFKFAVGGGVQTGSTRHVGHLLAYCTYPGWFWGWGIWWNEDWQEKSNYSEKTCPSATLSTTNPTWPDPGSNPGRRGGRPANNRLSYGAALNRTIVDILHADLHAFLHYLDRKSLNIGAKNKTYLLSNTLSLRVLRSSRQLNKTGRK
jgi:hypothetical protein